MKTDGIIFDLDGTLWDSCRAVAESWGHTLRREYGAEHWPSAEDIKSVMGTTAQQIARMCFPSYGDRALEVCLKCIADQGDYFRRHGGGDVYEGVEKMLSALCEKYPLFIVSNCKDGYIQCFLELSGLGKYFRDFECEGSTGLSKAENIRLMTDRHRLEHPIYLGDTSSDEKSAKAAGAVFVHAAYGFGKAVDPDASAESPEHFMHLILGGE